MSATAVFHVPHRPDHPARRPLAHTVVRWLARLTSLASLGVLLAFAFGEGTPTAREWLLLAFFPIGLALGMIVGWWRELLGGAIALGSMAVFYALIFAISHKLPSGPYFAILASPAALFVAAGLLARATLSAERK